MNRDDELIKRGNAKKAVDDPDIIFDWHGTIDRIPAEPHEMTAKEYLYQSMRMCKSHARPDPVGPECSKCDFLDYCVEPQYYPSNLEDCIAVVEQWAKDHPEKRKTYAEDYFEKFPKAPHSKRFDTNEELDIPAACRMSVYGMPCYTDCDCIACWNEEMEASE